MPGYKLNRWVYLYRGVDKKSKMDTDKKPNEDEKLFPKDRYYVDRQVKKKTVSLVASTKQSVPPCDGQPVDNVPNRHSGAEAMEPNQHDENSGADAPLHGLEDTPMNLTDNVAPLATGSGGLQARDLHSQYQSQNLYTPRTVGSAHNNVSHQPETQILAPASSAKRAALLVRNVKLHFSPEMHAQHSVAPQAAANHKGNHTASTSESGKTLHERCQTFSSSLQSRGGRVLPAE